MGVQKRGSAAEGEREDTKLERFGSGDRTQTVKVEERHDFYRKTAIY